MKKKWDTIRLIINRKKKCSNFCPIKSQVLGKHYSTMAEKLIEKLPKLHKNDIKVIVLYHGGEPLLNKSFFKYVDEIWHTTPQDEYKK